MEIPRKCPTSQRTIVSVPLSFPMPFKMGDTISSEGMADQLNQVLIENLKNNFAKAVKGAIDEGKGTPEYLQPRLDQLVKDYNFGVRSGRGFKSGDPVKAEEHRMAKDAVLKALRKKGHKDPEKTVPPEKLAKFITDTITKNPQLHEAAMKRVAARQQERATTRAAQAQAQAQVD